MQFNQVLTELMEKKEVSNYRLAMLLNVAKSTIANWLNGSSSPDCYKLLEISQIFEVSADFLLTGKNTEQKLISIDEHISDKELEAIKKYRQITDIDRDEIDTMLNMKYKRVNAHMGVRAIQRQCNIIRFDFQKVVK